MKKLFKLGKSNTKNFSFFNATNKDLHVGVHSIDHDNCIGLQHMTPNEVKKKHAPVIEHLQQEKINKGYTSVFVLGGTNRQDLYRECWNAKLNQNNFAFLIAKTFADLLGAGTFHDPLLLADIKAKCLPGFTINYIQQFVSRKKLNLFESCVSNEVLDELLSKDDHPKFAYSEDKINILYAQMHRIALMNPHARISFNFYDDLLEKVLRALQKFYESNSSLMPSNVRLNLHYFNTAVNSLDLHNSMDVPELLYTIEGTGSIDPKYYDTIQAMEDIAIKEEGKQKEGEMGTYSMSKYITPSRLEHHKLEYCNNYSRNIP